MPMWNWEFFPLVKTLTTLHLHLDKGILAIGRSIIPLAWNPTIFPYHEEHEDEEDDEATNNDIEVMKEKQKKK